MAQLSKETILELQWILKEEYGVKYTFAEASEAARNLIGFFDLLARVDARNKREQRTKRNRKL